MNKKAVYSILSVIVAMVVLSVSLVFAIGPRVSADSEPFVVLDKAEYFNIDNGVLCGISHTGHEYAGGYENWKVIIPEGVVEITGLDDGSDCWNSLDCVVCNVHCGARHTISLKLPKSLKRIGNYAFYALDRLSELEIPYGVTSIGDGAFDMYGIASITIPANVTEVGKYIFCDAVCGPCASNYELTEIIVENPDLMTYENLQPYASIMRYEAPQNVPEDPIDPVQPENEVNNQNNNGLIVGITGSAAGILIVAGIVVGIVIAKRRRK